MIGHTAIVTANNQLRTGIMDHLIHDQLTHFVTLSDNCVVSQQTQHQQRYSVIMFYQCISIRFFKYYEGAKSWDVMIFCVDPYYYVAT